MQLSIDVIDIKKLSEEHNIPYFEDNDSFHFIIEKPDHEIDIQILKTGEYIFLSLLFQNKEYPFEHLEFYMDESYDEILEELTLNLTRIKTNETRIFTLRKKSKTKIKVEINENNEWNMLGYPAREN